MKRISLIIVSLLFLLILVFVTMRQITGLDEGEEGNSYPGNISYCKFGLTATDTHDIGGTCGFDYHLVRCIRCGNGLCGEGEDRCNCPSDCR